MCTREYLPLYHTFPFLSQLPFPRQLDQRLHVYRPDCNTRNITITPFALGSKFFLKHGFGYTSRMLCIVGEWKRKGRYVCTWHAGSPGPKCIVEYIAPAVKQHVGGLAPLANKGYLLLSLHCADEELRPISVRASIGHTNSPRTSVLQLKILVRELVAINGFSACAITTGKVTTLCRVKEWFDRHLSCCQRMYGNKYFYMPPSSRQMSKTANKPHIKALCHWMKWQCRHWSCFHPHITV